MTWTKKKQAEYDKRRAEYDRKKATEQENLRSYGIKKGYIKKSTEAITATSSKAINRLDLTIVRWGQDGWILDYLTEHIFKGLMRDFHLESGEDGATVGMSPETLFHFYIEGIENNSLPTPMSSIDLKKAKDFIQKPISEKKLFEAIEKVGSRIFKGGFVLPKIIDLDTKEVFTWVLPKDEAIFSYTIRKKEELGEKPKGRKTVKHYRYYILLTFMGIYLIFIASSFYNVEFLPKALYRLNHACNDFFRSIAGFWHVGHVKLSYLKVRERMRIRQETNSSIERQYIERNLDYLKNNNIIEDWKRIVKGNRKYIKNEEIIYDITISLKNRERSRNYAIRKSIEKQKLLELKINKEDREVEENEKL